MTDETTPSPIVTIDDTPIGQCVGPLSFFEPKPLFTFHGDGTTVARLECVDGRWRFSLGEGVEVDDAARGMLEALGSMMPMAETHGIPAQTLAALAKACRDREIDPATLFVAATAGAERACPPYRRFVMTGCPIEAEGGR